MSPLGKSFSFPLKSELILKTEFSEKHEYIVTTHKSVRGRIDRLTRVYNENNELKTLPRITVTYISKKTH